MSEIQDERNARILELENRRSRRRSTGVRWWVSLSVLALSAFFLWQQRLEISYLFSPLEPISLGSEGGYSWSRLNSNRFARVAGVPTTRGAYEKEGQQTFVFIGLLGTPLMVRRPALPTEVWEDGSIPPSPSQLPYSGRGRLLRAEDASTYAHAFLSLKKMGEIEPRWLLIEGDLPRKNLATWFWLSIASVFALLNGWLLLKELTFGRHS